MRSNLSEVMSAVPKVEPIGKTFLAITILTGCLLGWLAFTYPPKKWQLSDELSNVTMYSPAEDIAKRDAADLSNLWNNTLLKFTVSGLGVGAAALVLLGRNSIGTTVATLIAGPICGLLAGWIGLTLRQYVDLGHPIPFISDQIRPLICDSLVYATISILLLFPFAIMLGLRGDRLDRQRALSVLVGGLLTGMVVPITCAAVLDRSAHTGHFPPEGTGVTVLWFVALGVLATAISLLTRSRNLAKDAASETELGAV